jgi:hypothetical protein
VIQPSIPRPAGNHILGDEQQKPYQERAEKCWTLFLGLLPLAPNSLAVRTRHDHELRFVLWGRSSWMAAIHDLTHQGASAADQS